MAGLARELALRIGLAARALPGPGLPGLMAALVDALGVPFSAAKFAQLTVGRLRTAAGGVLAEAPRAALREALGHLQGRIPVVIADAPAPALDPCRDGAMPGSIRVAVASDGGELADGHFGHCRAYLVYQVSARELRLIDYRYAPEPGAKSARGAAHVALVGDCHLVYGRVLGNQATAQLMHAGVHPVCAPEGGPARDRLRPLQAILRGHPPPWLARAMGTRGWVMPASGNAGLRLAGQPSVRALPH
ncbi:dinitrogenase iron-molybdenum cofactor biosynthesis protein [Parasulfuritortus cantonensis]|uniref:Dinitrogenase iron-molybdenum cofactor biosynthesis protein n=1 Tax=Parasulfuritortus cantonensis TaxID=2528202 RepID=A0A4R1BCV7_9PROT|nr:dinitrogenase iron-molybdenum cofactor N-terminal domain-containing protein [Parasulfuritortus cantonensis]TCJ14900.1 dinitrogenase iron-molybdenum cofactor biosynthesis protein [Parasulfuritortus cantonensis]